MSEQTFLERLQQEKTDLDGKLDKLVPFMNSEKFVALSLKHRKLLERQRLAMTQYSEILGERLTDLAANPPA